MSRTRPQLLSSKCVSRWKSVVALWLLMLPAAVAGSGKTICSIVPDACSGGKSLSDLRLSKRGLSGTIPSELALSNGTLRLLDLQGNFLSGTIPAALAAMTQLTSVALNQNRLSGWLPTSLGGLALVTSINVSANNLSGTLGGPLAPLHRLSHLHFGFTRISGTLPTQLGQVPTLESLTYGDNPSLSGVLPTELGELRALRTLITCSEHSPALHQAGAHLEVGVSGTLPTQLGLISSITRLDISFTSLSGTLPTSLSLLGSGSGPLALQAQSVLRLSGTLPSEWASERAGVLGYIGLSFLIIAETRLSGTLPMQWAHAPWRDQLKVLVVGASRDTIAQPPPGTHPQISGTLPHEFASLANVVSVAFPITAISGTLPAAYSRMGGGRLRKLWLGHNRLSGTLPPEWSLLHGLDSLRLPANYLEGWIPPSWASLFESEGEPLAHCDLRTNHIACPLPKRPAACVQQIQCDWHPPLPPTSPPRLPPPPSSPPHAPPALPMPGAPVPDAPTPRAAAPRWRVLAFALLGAALVAISLCVLTRWMRRSRRAFSTRAIFTDGGRDALLHSPDRSAATCTSGPQLTATATPDLATATTDLAAAAAAARSVDSSSPDDATIDLSSTVTSPLCSSANAHDDVSLRDFEVVSFLGSGSCAQVCGA